MNSKQDYDVLGFIYEYLIGMFAATAGKKAGEFYTPHEVSVLMSELVAHALKDRKKDRDLRSNKWFWLVAYQHR
jgi:type I restriction enzyme M protein